MKSCPECGKDYPNEYSFCLADGTPLVDAAFVPEEATVVRAAPTKERTKTGTILLFLLAGFLTLALGATIAVLYHVWPTSEQTRVNEPSPSLSASRQVSEPTKTPETNVRPSATPAPTNSNIASPKPPPPPDEVEPDVDPGPLRISFQRGRANETISGSVVDTRSFVLTARSGQNLTATVRSADGCVSFNGRAPRLNFETDEGDNMITLVNTCGEPSRFVMNVNIR